jgi:hypothetical protein
MREPGFIQRAADVATISDFGGNVPFDVRHRSFETRDAFQFRDAEASAVGFPGVA